MAKSLPLIKYVRVVISLLFLCTITKIGFSQYQIEGTVHDFSESLTATVGQLCVACHRTHSVGLDAPLWSRKFKTLSFDEYQSASFDANEGGGWYPIGGISKACLSCHDGATPVTAFYKGSSLNSPTSMTDLGYTTSIMGTDLMDDHPVSIEYTTALATKDGDLANPSDVSGLGGTIQEDLLFDNKIECSTCHDIHGPPGAPYFLRKSMDQSGLCMTCHTK